LFEATTTMLLTMLKAKLHRATVTGADMLRGLDRHRP
jgi:hypothetical protein